MNCGKNRKGQIAVEYMILLAAVIAVLIAFLNRPEGETSVREVVRMTLDGAVNQIQTEASNMGGSQ